MKLKYLDNLLMIDQYFEHVSGTQEGEQTPDGGRRPRWMVGTTMTFDFKFNRWVRKLIVWSF